MARKVSLPVSDRLLDALGPPTLAAMRARLGGRLEWGEAPVDGAVRIGAFVAVGEPTGASVASRVGIVLALGGLEADVYLTRGMVKRTLASLLVVHEGDVPAELTEIRPSVEAFARLTEGQRVWFDRGTSAATGDRPRPRLAEGTLLEKCRYGALVGDLDGKVVGVGFRKLFDSPPVAPNAN